MKPVFVVSLVVLAISAVGYVSAGNLGTARLASPAPAGAGAPVRPANMRVVTLKVDNMYCASCPYIVKQSLAGVPGVTEVAVSYRDKTAVVTFDTARTSVAMLARATTEAGYPSRLLSR
jgi:periplasmic mercuric ion binding protein